MGDGSEAGAANGLAAAVEVPAATAVLINYPGYIRSVDKAVHTLGGAAAVSEAVDTGKAYLQLPFRWANTCAPARLGGRRPCPPKESTTRACTPLPPPAQARAAALPPAVWRPQAAQGLAAARRSASGCARGRRAHHHGGCPATRAGSPTTPVRLELDAARGWTRAGTSSLLGLWQRTRPAGLTPCVHATAGRAGPQAVARLDQAFTFDHLADFQYLAHDGRSTCARLGMQCRQPACSSPLPRHPRAFARPSPNSGGTDTWGAGRMTAALL